MEYKRNSRITQISKNQNPFVFCDLCEAFQWLLKETQRSLRLQFSDSSAETTEELDDSCGSSGKQNRSQKSAPHKLNHFSTYTSW